MPRISDIVLLDMTEQPALCISVRTRVEELPKVIGESYGRICTFMASLNALPAEVPFVYYRNMDMQNLDVQMGFPVATAYSGSGDIEYCPVPAGKKIFCMYRGPYSQMAPVYDEMAAWIAQNGFEPIGTAYEHYYNGPETLEEDFLTKIVMPVK